MVVFPVSVKLLGMSELKIIKGEAFEMEEQAARQIKDIVCESLTQ